MHAGTWLEKAACLSCIIKDLYASIKNTNRMASAVVANEAVKNNAMMFLTADKIGDLTE